MVQKLEETSFRNDDTPFFPLLRLSLAMPQSEPSPSHHHAAQRWLHQHYKTLDPSISARSISVIAASHYFVESGETKEKLQESLVHGEKEEEVEEEKEKVREDQGSKVNDSEKT